MNQKDNLSSIGKPKRGRGKGRPPRNRSSQDLHSSIHSTNLEHEFANVSSDPKSPHETGSKQTENQSNPSPKQYSLANSESSTSKLTKSPSKDNKQVLQKDEMFKIPKCSPSVKKPYRSCSRDRASADSDGDDRDLELVIDGFAILSYSSQDDIMAALKKSGNVYENPRVNIDSTKKKAANIKTPGRTPVRTPRGRSPRGSSRGRSPRGGTPISISTRLPRGRPPGVPMSDSSPRGRGRGGRGSRGGRGGRGIRGFRRGPGRPPRNPAALLLGTRTPPSDFGDVTDYTPDSNSETPEIPITPTPQPTDPIHTELFTPVTTLNMSPKQLPVHSTESEIPAIIALTESSTNSDIYEKMNTDNEGGDTVAKNNSIPTTVHQMADNLKGGDNRFECGGVKTGSNDKPKKPRRGRGRAKGVVSSGVGRRKSTEPSFTPLQPIPHLARPMLPNNSNPSLISSGHLPPLLPALPPRPAAPGVCSLIEKKMKHPRNYPPPIEIRPAPVSSSNQTSSTTKETMQSGLSRPIQPQFSPISPPAESAQLVDKFPLMSGISAETDTQNTLSTALTTPTSQSTPTTSTVDAQNNKSANKDHRQRGEDGSLINKKPTPSPSLQSRAVDNISRTASRASDRTTSSNAANSTSDPVHPALFGVTPQYPLATFPPANMLSSALLGMNPAVSNNPTLPPSVTPAAFYRPEVLAALSTQPGFGMNRTEIPGGNPAVPQTDRNNPAIHPFLLAMQTGLNPVSLAASANNPLFGGDGSMEQFQQMLLQRMTNPNATLQTTSAQTTSQPQASTPVSLYQSVNVSNPQASTTTSTGTAMSSSPNNVKKLTGRWNKAHVKIAWDIFNQKRANQVTDKKTSSKPLINANNSVLRPNPNQLPSAFTAKSSKYSNFPNSIIPLKTELNPSHSSTKSDTHSTLLKPSLLPKPSAELKKISPKPDPPSSLGKTSDLPTLAPKPAENLSLPGKSNLTKPAETTMLQKPADVASRIETFMKSEKSQTPTKPDTSSSNPHNSMSNMTTSTNSMNNNIPTSSSLLTTAGGMSSGVPANSSLPLGSSSLSYPFKTDRSESPHYNTAMNLVNGSLKDSRSSTPSSQGTAVSSGPPRSNSTSSTSRLHTGETTQPQWSKVNQIIQKPTKTSQPKHQTQSNDVNNLRRPQSNTTLSSSPSTPTDRYSSLKRSRTKSPSSSTSHKRKITHQHAELTQRNNTSQYLDLSNRNNAPQYTELTSRNNTSQYAELTPRNNTSQYADLTSKSNPPTYTELTNKSTAPQYTELTNMNGNTPYNGEMLQQIMARGLLGNYMSPGLNGAAATPSLQAGLAPNLLPWNMDKVVGYQAMMAEKWQEILSQQRNHRPMDAGVFPGYQYPGLQQSTSNSRPTGSAGASTNGTSSDIGEPHS